MLVKTLLKRIESQKPEKIFLFLGLLFGLLFIFIVPPFQSPDEAVHFLRSYQVSEGDLTLDKLSDGKVGAKLPSSIYETIDLTTTDPSISFKPDRKYDIYKTQQALSIDNNSQDRSYDFSATGSYGPVAYMPQSIGIGLARLLDLPVVGMMYLGRIMNLLSWLLVIYLAIKLMPVKKWLVVFVGLLPMALSQASTLSSDTASIGILVLYIAFLLSVIHKKGLMSKKELVSLLILGSLLCLTKQLMFLFVALAAIVPSIKFVSLKQSLLMRAILVGVPILVLVAWLIISNAGTPDSLVNNGQNPKEQLKFVIFNPHSFINVLWNTYFFTWGDGITRSFIGNFGWADAPLSEAIVVFGYLTLAIVMFSGANLKKGVFKLDRIQRIVVFLVSSAYFIGTSLALYLFYTPLEYKIIYGLQGRYFIPLILLVMLLVNKNFTTTTPEFYRKTAIFAPVILLTASMITVYVRFYVNNV